MCDFFISVLSHLDFAKLAMLRFSKGYCCHSFHSISNKLYCKYVGHEGLKGITFWQSAKIKKCLWYFENFVNTGPCRIGNFKNTTPPKHSSSSEPNFLIR